MHQPTNLFDTVSIVPWTDFLLYCFIALGLLSSRTLFYASSVPPAPRSPTDTFLEAHVLDGLSYLNIYEIIWALITV